MDFRTFIITAEEHLVRSGNWWRTGFNEIWPVFFGFGESQPLPAALVIQFSLDCAFSPEAELYLRTSGWFRVSTNVTTSWPIFAKSIDGEMKYKRLPLAIVEQLKIDCLRGISETEAVPGLKLQLVRG